MAEHATASQLDRVAAGYVKSQRNDDPDKDAKDYDERSLHVESGDDGVGKITSAAPTISSR